MNLLYKAKLRLGIISLEKRIQEYDKIEKSIQGVETEKDILITEHSEIRGIAEKNLRRLVNSNGETPKEEASYLTKAINEKYNNYLSKYLDKIEKIKGEINKLELEQDNLFKGNNTARIYLNKIRKEDELKRNENYKYKDFVDSGLKRARETMPQIDHKDLDKFLMHFSSKAQIKKDKIKLKDIKPSQKDFNNEKILNIYKKGNYKDFKYILSKDNYLMDGHHNWAAGLEDDVNREVDIYKVNLPISDLIKRSNMLKISKKRDIYDKEIQKAAIIIAEAYRQNKITEQDFEKAKEQIKKTFPWGAQRMLGLLKSDNENNEEKEVREINREILNPDDGIPHKSSRDYVMYNDETPSKTGKEYCGNCAFFNEEDETCQIVEGNPGSIKREGWCTLWGIDLLQKPGTKTKTEEKLKKAEESEVEKVDTPADTRKEEINRNKELQTMWQLKEKLTEEGKINSKQTLVFFCPVYFPGQKIVEALLNREDEHGEKMLFPLPMIKDSERVKIGLKQMESLGIENPEQYIKEDEEKGGKGLLTYSSLPGIEGVHNNIYEYIANEFVQLGAFQIVPNEWVNQGDPINDTYKFPGEEGYSPYWRIPTFEEFSKLRPDLAKNYEKTDKGIVKKFEKEEIKEGWRYKDAYNYAQKIKNKFEETGTESKDIIIWENIAGFDRVEVKDESIPHDFPKPHKDFVYSYKKISDEDVKKLQNVIDDLTKITGSIFFDGLKKEIGARCGMLIKNADTLTFVRDVLEGKVQPTKENYSDYIVNDKFGEWYKDEMKEKEIKTEEVEKAIEYKELNNIAEKYKINLNTLQKQIDIGIDTEMKKGKTQEEAEKEALKNIKEKPNYYSQLKKDEK